MALREWPDQVRVEQDQIGGRHVDCFDADTGAKLTRVLRAVVIIEQTPDIPRVEITMSRYDPDEVWSARLHYPIAGEEQGIAVETRTYYLTQLSLEAGYPEVKP